MHDDGMVDSPALALRTWVPPSSESLVQSIASSSRTADPEELSSRLSELAAWGDRIHDVECVNLNPATNTMNPAAVALAASGLGTRPSLGYPGAKYEMGLEAVEQIEVIAAELAAEVFGARYAEIRVPSGAIANLYGFMACASPGDTIIVPPATIAGHVTHHRAGAAGLYGLEIHEAPIDAERYSIDVPALSTLAERVKPKLITLGSSLNLVHHDVAGVRAVADSVGAKVLFDAAHLSGPIAGKAWPHPLRDGAHLMTMSTYKSLAGPAGGLLVTSDPEIAERVDRIAFPGLTANFDAGKTAALARTLLDWRTHGEAYAGEMVASAAALAEALEQLGVAVHRAGVVPTRSHAFAVDCRETAGGHQTAMRLRQANLLTSAIGLPTGLDDGLRLGTNELVRWGATREHMPALAELVAAALLSGDPASLAADVTRFRAQFDTIHYIV